MLEVEVEYIIMYIAVELDTTGGTPNQTIAGL
jgi:hypothetical protein